MSEIVGGMCVPVCLFTDVVTGIYTFQITLLDKVFCGVIITWGLYLCILLFSEDSPFIYL